MVFLSRRGMLTLINLTLSSILTYYLSIFKILVGIAKKLEKLMRDFCRKNVSIGSKSHIKLGDDIKI